MKNLITKNLFDIDFLRILGVYKSQQSFYTKQNLNASRRSMQNLLTHLRLQPYFSKLGYLILSVDDLWDYLFQTRVKQSVTFRARGEFLNSKPFTMYFKAGGFATIAVKLTITCVCIIG